MEHPRGHVEDVADHLIGHDLLGRTGRGDRPVLECHEHVRVPRREREFMQHHDQGDPSGALQCGEDVQDLGLARDVQIRRGFVEQQYVRVLREREGDPHALALTAGQVPHAAFEQLPQPGEFDRFRHGVVVLGTPPSEGATVRVPSARHEFLHGHALGCHGVLWEETHGAREPGAVPPTHVRPAHEDLSGGRGELARARLEQRGLPATVGPHERGHGPRGERHVHVPQHRRLAVAHGQPPHRELGRRRRVLALLGPPGPVRIGHGRHASAFPRPINNHSSTGAPAAAVTTPTGRASPGIVSAAT